MSRIKKIISAAFLIMAAAFIVAAFSACVSSEYEDQALKLQDDGYTVESLDYTGYRTDSVWRIDAVKGSGETLEYVRIIYFASEDAAIDYYTEVFTEGLDSLEIERPDMVADLTHLRVGNIVMYGTSGGVEDALA